MVATTTEEPSSSPVRAGGLEDDRLELRQDDGEILHRLLRQFDAVNDEQHALGIARGEKAPDERGAEKRLAGAGRHFEKKLAAAFSVEQPGNLIHGSDLVTAESAGRV